MVSAAEIRSYVEGKIVESEGDALAYGSNGRYTHNGGSPGRYTISDGKICVTFDSGRSRCDRIVRRNGGGYAFVNANGERFSFARR